MKDYFLYLRYRLGTIALFAAFEGLLVMMERLYGLSAENAVYSAALFALLFLCTGAVDCARFLKKLRLLRDVTRQTRLAESCLPETSNPLELAYQSLVQSLLRDKAESESRRDQKMHNLTGYYTLWAHQIKTPIAAMRLLLQERGGESDELSQELMRVEQYVDMALGYARLDSEQTDYVIRRCELDEIVRPVVRKFAPQFIRKKLTLRYEALNVRVLTDEKWLSFVVEQVLSNALKYTAAGEIRIFCEPGPTLVITDTGIGIAPEDLPRVFDRGFTGYNGRADKKATGIGLYLCRRICRKLGHEISMTSEPGHGTQARIYLGAVERVQE